MKEKVSLAVWKVKTGDFPKNKKIEQQIKFLLRYAILAPSGHNSQPWKFSIEENKLRVYADLERSRPEVDPENRELYISLGCAITNIEVAAKKFRLVWEENWWPKADQPNLIVELTFSEDRREYEGMDQIFEAITQRSTSRSEFKSTKVSNTKFKQMEDKWCGANGAQIRWVTETPEKELVAELVAQAQKVWFRSKKLTEELKFWLKKDLMVFEKKNKGVVALNNFSLNLQQFLGTEYQDIDQRAERDKGWLLQAPLIGVLMTSEDHKKAWVEGGRKFQYLTLWATSQNLQTGYFNSVAELPKKRAQLALILGEKKWPQLLFRMGQGERGRQSPRSMVKWKLV